MHCSMSLKNSFDSVVGDLQLLQGFYNIHEAYYTLVAVLVRAPQIMKAPITPVKGLSILYIRRLSWWRSTMQLKYH